ncbi:unnamed protein product [Thlaspi arvense]|uniref:Uncharacterized protein n=1 Tax=Thlaspi arvense TaxID=13288 RepID=A0AAU9T803_THLAR|nr:unnamed protein product [Thlaspi arvense]
MFTASSEGGDDGDITKFGDSTDLVVSPLAKKPRLDLKVEAEAEAKVEPEVRILRRPDLSDPDYKRQREMYFEQYEKSEGYDVDWDSITYDFAAVKFEWGGDFDDVISNDELLKRLIESAIGEENEENGTQLEFVKYVSANVIGVQGFLFFITFWAKDVSSPDPEPKLYQTKVRKFMDEDIVVDFRLRPTQELFGSILTLNM